MLNILFYVKFSRVPLLKVYQIWMTSLLERRWLTKNELLTHGYRSKSILLCISKGIVWKPWIEMHKVVQKLQWSRSILGGEDSSTESHIWLEYLGRWIRQEAHLYVCVCVHVHTEKKERIDRYIDSQINKIDMHPDLPAWLKWSKQVHYLSSLGFYICIISNEVYMQIDSPQF